MTRLKRDSEEGSNASNEIAEKIKYLLETTPKSNGELYRLHEIERLSGGKITYSWLWKLLNGRSIRPSLETLTAVSDFFGVGIEFWQEPLDSRMKIKVLDKRSENEVNVLAGRILQLNEAGRGIVANLVESLLANGMAGVTELEADPVKPDSVENKIPETQG